MDHLKENLKDSKNVWPHDKQIYLGILNWCKKIESRRQSFLNKINTVDSR